MHPSITEQLDGIRHVLATVVAPQVGDPYAADVLAGIVATIETLGRWDEVPAFLRTDAERTARLLAAIGVATPSMPDDLLDIAALTEHHRTVRAALERAMPEVLADPDARVAAAQLFRERCAQFPLANRRAGQQPAATSTQTVPRPTRPDRQDPDAHATR